jgi:hypothetical protein
LTTEFFVGTKNVLGDLIQESDFALECFNKFIQRQSVLSDRLLGLAPLLLQVGIDGSSDGVSICVSDGIGFRDG